MINTTNKGVFAPWKWGHKHIEIMFDILSQMPLANSIYEIGKQANDAFSQAGTEFVMIKNSLKPVPKDLQSFPSFRSEDRLKGLPIAAAVTTREFFLYGENGALEVRKLGQLTGLTDVFYFAKELLQENRLCYAKAGKDGRDVWGRNMFAPSYLNQADVMKSLRNA